MVHAPRLGIKFMQWTIWEIIPPSRRWLTMQWNPLLWNIKPLSCQHSNQALHGYKPWSITLDFICSFSLGAGRSATVLGISVWPLIWEVSYAFVSWSWIAPFIIHWGAVLPFSTIFFFSTVNRTLAGVKTFLQGYDGWTYSL